MFPNSVKTVGSLESHQGGPPDLPMMTGNLFCISFLQITKYLSKVIYLCLIYFICGHNFIITIYVIHPLNSKYNRYVICHTSQAGVRVAYLLSQGLARADSTFARGRRTAWMPLLVNIHYTSFIFVRPEFSHFFLDSQQKGYHNDLHNK